MIEIFKKVKSSMDPEIMTDFLIELSNNVKKEHFHFLKFFIDDLEERIFEKIKLNLIYLIGEFGKIMPLNREYIDFLVDNYLLSDRWVRNEIIVAINKISFQIKLPKEILNILGQAIHDDYSPIQMNVLKFFMNFDDLPDTILLKILLLLDSFNSDFLEATADLLQKFVQNEEIMFKLLNADGNYRTLNKKTIRALLITCYRSVLEIESFREKISSSSWESIKKEMYLEEIDTYERILLKNRF